jgi:hypothetical protein
VRARLAVIISASLAVPLLCAAGGALAAAAPVQQLSVKVTDTPPGSASITVMNVATGSTRHLGGNGQLDLRAGTYNVAAWFGLGSQSVTLADQVVTLNRDRTVTLSPAGGVPVVVNVGNAGAQEESLELAPFAAGRWATPDNPSGALPTPPVPSLPLDNTYVVPMSSKLVTLYVYSVWQKAGSSADDPSPYRYDIVHEYTGGLPSEPDIRVTTAQLARVDVTARQLDPDQQAILNLEPVPPTVGAAPLSASTALGATPAHLVSYRSPGFRWLSYVYWQSPSTVPNADNELEEYSAREPRYGLGHYTETWGQAVLAPMADSVYVERDKPHMLVGLLGSAWADPFHQADGAEFAGATLRLYSGGKLVGSSAHGVQVDIPYPGRPHAYVLDLTATRLPDAGLSSTLIGAWRFTAGGAYYETRTFNVTLAPAALNDRNQAAPGSLTAVTLGIVSRPDWVPFPIRAVQAWVSANDGATWKLATVRKVHGRYVLYARNAATAGYASLRVYVTDSRGNYERLTVIHAYGVS